MNRSCNRKKVRRANRKGLSLLEVLLALAILGGSLAVIGQLVNLGLKAARKSQLQSASNIMADAKMAEVAAGVLALQSTSLTPIEENEGWGYSVEVSDSELPGLLTVTVSVEQTGAVANPIRLTINRLMADPDYDPDEEE